MGFVDTVYVDVMHVAGRPAQLSFRHQGELIELWIEGQYVATVGRASLRRWLARTGPRHPLVCSPLVLRWVNDDDYDGVGNVSIEVHRHIAPTRVEVGKVRSLLQLVSF